MKMPRMSTVNTQEHFYSSSPPPYIFIPSPNHMLCVLWVGLLSIIICRLLSTLHFLLLPPDSLPARPTHKHSTAEMQRICDTGPSRPCAHPPSRPLEVALYDWLCV